MAAAEMQSAVTGTAVVTADLQCIGGSLKVAGQGWKAMSRWLVSFVS
jgi:hypothetical protein